jgi:putative protease
MAEALVKVGTVAHYFGKIGVAVVEVTAPLKVGDRITVRGLKTSLDQTVESMEVNHKSVTTAKKGDSIGLKVNGYVREGDAVYILAVQ